MKKVLIVATVVRFLNFERNDIKILREMGYEVHCATNLIDENERTKDIEMIRHQIDFARSPFSRNTLVAYKQLKKLLQEEKFNLIHCHTPVGGILARLVARKYRKKGELKVIYTAHGFHFFKGAPLKNWLLYFPIEWICSWMTDVLITINKEDYERARSCLCAKRVEYIPGVGLKVEHFLKCEVDVAEKRKKLNVDEDSFVILSVGELSSRKNQQIVIEALNRIKNNKINYLIVGTGELEEEYAKLIQRYKLIDNVRLLGNRRDIDELCKCANVFVHPSVREGLGIAPLEAMASGLPLIGSYKNGMKDYVEHMKTGIAIHNPMDVDEMVKAIMYVMENATFCKETSEYNKKCVLNYDIGNVEIIMRKIYEIL